MRLGTPSFVALCTAALAMNLACGGDDDPPPTAVTSPTPTPASTPTPIPSPSIPGMASCSRLPMAQPTGHNCPRETPNFQTQVETAIAQLRAQQPDIFQESGDGTLILSAGRFFTGVIENLDRMGICAGFDTEELQVTNSPAFNDQFHLRTSRGLLRHGETMYRATCYPAAFPTPLPPPRPNNGCRLASSYELACQREERFFYYQDIEASIDQVIREHPEIFDMAVRAPGTNWPGVHDFERYHQFIVQAMISRGYCSWFDGEEVQAKRENRFSEHYDVFLGDGFVRRGEGTYRSTCYPAAF